MYTSEPRFPTFEVLRFFKNNISIHSNVALNPSIRKEIKWSLNILNIINRARKLKKVSLIFEFDHADYKFQLHDKLYPMYEHLIS